MDYRRLGLSEPDKPAEYTGRYDGKTVTVASDKDLQDILSRAQRTVREAKKDKNYWYDRWSQSDDECKQLNDRVIQAEAECEAHRSYRSLVESHARLVDDYAELAKVHVALVVQTAGPLPGNEEPDPEYLVQEADSADPIMTDEEGW